jgi:hypothetical protein
MLSEHGMPRTVGSRLMMMRLVFASDFGRLLPALQSYADGQPEGFDCASVAGRNHVKRRF